MAKRWIYLAAWLPGLAIYLVAFLANGVPLDLAVRNAVANFVPDVVLGLLVLRLPWRWVWAGALPFLLASGLLWVALIGVDSLIFDGMWRVHIEPRLVPWRVLMDLFIYAAVAGLGHGARAARAEALRARAELQAMRSQLNPHFILNTFHALLGLVRRDPALAEEALERLGDLLRHSLRIQRDGVDEVTLREEWAFVAAYLELERLRLGDRLRVTCDADDAALDCRVPSFAVQTLVENAIRHAIAPRAAGGQLAVSARRHDGRLRVEVRDDGTGAPAGDGTGIGLTLLRERLAALYQGRARVALDVAPGGACAVLEVPA